MYAIKTDGGGRIIQTLAGTIAEGFTEVDYAAYRKAQQADGVNTYAVLVDNDVIITEAETSAEEKVAAYRAAVGRHIDQQAREFGFDSIVTAVTYADEPADPLNQSYGVALRAWRSKCWEKCREVLAAWQSGGAEPTVEELIASLPDFVGP